MLFFQVNLRKKLKGRLQCDFELIVCHKSTKKSDKSKQKLQSNSLSNTLIKNSKCEIDMFLFTSGEVYYSPISAQSRFWTEETGNLHAFLSGRTFSYGLILRLYLIRIGPHQPILQQYPSTTRGANEAYKYSRFNPAWFKEYPHLEYSLSKDVTCFVCFLFGGGPETEKADSAWVKEGVRSRHKFKSCGTKKQGKLATHFSSEAHKKTLFSYAHFAKASGHVDVLLDKVKRSALIQEKEDLQQIGE